MLLAGKVMATVALNSEGVICFDYLQKGKRSDYSTMQNYWTNPMPNCRKSGEKTALFH